MNWVKAHRHLILGWAWVLLAIPTVIWWKDAILWVALMSIYANAEASFAAHNAKSPAQDCEPESASHPGP